MKRLILALVFFSLGLSPRPSLSQEKVCPQELRAKIERAIASSEQQRANWGILVETIDPDGTLLALNPEKYFIPASNVKLLTAAAALLKFGPNYQIYTPIYISGKPPHLKKLIVIGKGDPSLKTEQLEVLAIKLKLYGVTSINQLIVEEGYLSEPTINPTWEFSDIFYYYAVPINSLILNENAVALSLSPTAAGEALELKWSDAIAARQWSVKNDALTGLRATGSDVHLNILFPSPTIHLSGTLASDAPPESWHLATLRPAEYFLDSLTQILEGQGIKILAGKIERKGELGGSIPSEQDLDDKSEPEYLFHQFASPELAELIATTNQESNNLFAEVIKKTLEANLTSIKAILTDLGVNPESYHLQDGSGLSRHNLASPQALVETLKLMSASDVAEVYRRSLAIAGVSGTLANRFKGTPVEGKLAGKTGTLAGVSALSGYLNLPDYQPLAFSIIVNQSSQEPSQLRKTIDEMVLLIAQLDNCQ